MEKQLYNTIDFYISTSILSISFLRESEHIQTQLVEKMSIHRRKISLLLDENQDRALNRVSIYALTFDGPLQSGSQTDRWHASHLKTIDSK